MKIIIRRMPPRMSLRPQRRPKHNQILRNTRMNKVHTPHRTTSVIEDPFVLVWTHSRLDAGIIWEGGRGDVAGSVGLLERGDDVVYCCCCGIWVEGEGFLEEDVHVARVEDVEV